MSAETWEWRTFLDAETSHEPFWDRLGVGSALRRRLLRDARVRTDSYIDLQDAAVGFKGRHVDALGMPRRIEIKVRTAVRGRLEEWAKVVRVRVPKNHSVRLYNPTGVRDALGVLEHLHLLEGPEHQGLLGRISESTRNPQVRVVHIWKKRTRMLLKGTGRNWRVLPAVEPSYGLVQVEHTELALHSGTQELQPLGWTVCCEQQNRNVVAEVAPEILDALGGRIMGYPEYICGISPPTPSET